ncbi:DUF4362 domain-containing protein [Paenibacillus wynnii]|uniref:DUF4362 domain-containing protein n=1 Tax=Paenibacillus wynnii TaxID=268407 RepID=UPI00278EFAD1|nr:DUF4362 domain-containing protein [Paenibacillus wynnii]MDQ0194322.1 hypothetical protein [Paenibacillus wynnii]
MKNRFWLSMVLFTLLIPACGRISTPEEAIQHGDVVSDYGVVGNIDKMDEFYNGVQLEKGNEIRIARFTKEGDPIFLYLTRKQGVILLKDDSRKDKNGSHMTTYTCEKLSKTKEKDSISYQLLNCQRTDQDESPMKQDIEILSIPAAL